MEKTIIFLSFATSFRASATKDWRDSGSWMGCGSRKQIQIFWKIPMAKCREIRDIFTRIKMARSSWRPKSSAVTSKVRRSREESLTAREGGPRPRCWHVALHLHPVDRRVGVAPAPPPDPVRTGDTVDHHEAPPGCFSFSFFFSFSLLLCYYGGRMVYATREMFFLSLPDLYL